MENESQGGPNRRNERVNEIRRRRLRLALHSRIACLTTLAVGAEALRPHRQSALFASAAPHNGGAWHHNISLSLISERAKE
jgi:hypothetical protein